MGKEKGLCLLQGKPLIEYSYDLLKKLCDSVVISANSKSYDYLNCTIIKDEFSGKGPAGGILSCLKASKTKDNFVISCDIPLVTAELISYILSNKAHYEVIVPVFKGFPEPLCAFYQKSCFSAFEDSINNGKYKLQDIIQDLSIKYLEIDSSRSFYHPNLFTNVNTPDDLQILNSKMLNNLSTHE